MARHFQCPDSTAAFLRQISPPVGIDHSEVTAVISPDDVCVSMKRLKRGKAAGPDEIETTFYRDYAGEITSLLSPLYTL